MLHDDFYFEPYDDIMVGTEAGCERYMPATPNVRPEHLQRAMLATGASAEEVRQYLRSEGRAG